MGRSKEFKAENIPPDSVFKKINPIPIDFTSVLGAFISSLLATGGGRGWEAGRKYTACYRPQGP